MSFLQIMALAAVTLFTAGSFLFALAETALFSLGDWRVRQLAADGSRAAKRLTRLLGDPAELVATLALGSTMANALLVTVVMLWTLDGHGVHPLVIAILLPGVLVGCEVVPKTLAVRAPDRWALRVAGLIQFFHLATSPVRRVAGAMTSVVLKSLIPASIRPHRQMTDGEYAELIELAFQQGSIARTEKDIILEIIRLDRRTVREVMRPRTQVIALSDELPVDEMIAEARRHGHRRLPLYDESPDTIDGILNVRKLLLDPQHDLAEAVEFPSFVPETMNLLTLLQSFQKQKRGLAVVLDEYGGTAGVVTLTDILRELLGELRGEGEEAALRIEHLGPRRWRVNGTVKVADFREEYPTLREHAEVDTVGGLLVSRLQMVPQAGQSVVVDGLRLTAEEVDERRVRVVRAEAVQDHRGKGGAA